MLQVQMRFISAAGSIKIEVKIKTGDLKWFNFKYVCVTYKFSLEVFVLGRKSMESMYLIIFDILGVKTGRTLQ